MGLSLRDPQPSQQISEAAPHVVYPPLNYFPGGGPGETLEAVWLQVWRTNEVLTLYEAALSRNEDKLERSILSIEGGAEWLGRTYDLYLNQKRGANAEWVDYLVDRALGRVLVYVNPLLELFTHPYIHQAHLLSEQRFLVTPDRLVASWNPRNLVGAMYLQFYWLITSAAEKSLCKHCGHIIPDAPPLPQDGARKRKPRSDKEYCNKQCRENHYYHTKRKPKRQEERTSG